MQNKCKINAKKFFRLEKFLYLYQQKQKQKDMKNVREIRVKANQQKRTFTIRTPHAKYRTLQMSQEEFDNAEFWTTNDWEQFLKTDEYYKVK